MHKIDGGGTEKTTDLPAALVLGYLQHLYEGFLFYVSEPDLGAVRKNWDDYGDEDSSPLNIRNSADGVTYYLEGLDGAPSSIGEGGNVGGPLECGGEEYPEVSQVIGDGEGDLW